MTTTTLTKTARTVFASASVAAGTPSRGRLDLQTAMGGLLTIKVTNGGTGPTVATTVNLLVAHNATQPSAGAAGTDWKTIASWGTSTTSSAVHEFFYEIPAACMGFEVEFTGNTVQAVTAESFFSEITSASS